MKSAHENLLQRPCGSLGRSTWRYESSAKKYVAPIFLLLITAFVSAARANTDVVECPASLNATSSVTMAPTGWEAVPGETRFPFERLAIFDGHPTDRASLVPDRGLEDSADGKTGVSEWRFPGGTKNIWLGCTYRGTPSMLARRIADGTLKCSAIAGRESWGWEFDRKLVCEKAT